MNLSQSVSLGSLNGYFQRGEPVSKEVVAGRWLGTVLAMVTAAPQSPQPTSQGSSTSKLHAGSGSELAPLLERLLGLLEPLSP